jgi:hypothetical protein
MWGVPQEIVERQLAHFKKAHPDYEAGVRRELDKMTRAKASRSLSSGKCRKASKAPSSGSLSHVVAANHPSPRGRGDACGWVRRPLAPPGQHFLRDW